MISYDSPYILKCARVCTHCKNWSCSWSSSITFGGLFVAHSLSQVLPRQGGVSWQHGTLDWGISCWYLRYVFLLVNPVQQKYIRICSNIQVVFHILLTRFDGIFSCGFVCGSHPFQRDSAVYRVEEVSSVDSNGSYNFFGQTMGQTNCGVHKQMVPKNWESPSCAFNSRIVNWSQSWELVVWGVAYLWEESHRGGFQVLRGPWRTVPWNPHRCFVVLTVLMLISRKCTKHSRPRLDKISRFHYCSCYGFCCRWYCYCCCRCWCCYESSSCCFCCWCCSYSYCYCYCFCCWCSSSSSSSSSSSASSSSSCYCFCYCCWCCLSSCC